MEIRFQTKEESKRLQREKFLKLSPGERFIQFLELSRHINQYPSLKSEKNKNNFILSKKS